MKKKFVKTKNVKNFISLMNNLQNRPIGVPGMALVYGEPGLGKNKFNTLVGSKKRLCLNIRKAFYDDSLAVGGTG